MKEITVVITVLPVPHCAPCHNFLKGNMESLKSSWLAPHVIKRRGENDTIVVWRCSWGEQCEAGCVYARAKAGSKE